LISHTSSTTRELLREFGLVFGRSRDPQIRQKLMQEYVVKTMKSLTEAINDGFLVNILADDFCSKRIDAIPKKVGAKLSVATKVANLAMKIDDGPALLHTDYIYVQDVVLYGKFMGPSRFNGFVFRSNEATTEAAKNSLYSWDAIGLTGAHSRNGKFTQFYLLDVLENKMHSNDDV
jgi:hypothetical protein